MPGRKRQFTSYSVALGVTELAKFLRAIADTHDDGDLYRGHTDEGWKLTPSAFRGTPRYGIVCPEDLERWKNRAGKLAHPRPTNDMEWVVLAQHHGLPTPLLDWTTNPLTALFFAAMHDPDAKHGCVWRAKRSAFDVFKRPEKVEVFKADRLKPGLIDASIMNQRSIAQDSAMSVHSPLNPGDFGIDLGGGNIERIFTLDRASKGEVRQALNLFGFSEARLFGDLDTVVRSFREELRAKAQWSQFVAAASKSRRKS